MNISWQTSGRNLALLILALSSAGGWASQGMSQTRLSQARNTHIRGDADIRSSFIDEDYQQARTAGLGIDLSLDHEPQKNLKVSLAVGVNLDTGSSQQLFSDEYKPSQGLALLDASLHWKPMRPAELSVGAINQSWLQNDMLVGKKAFPAVMGKWTQAFGNYYVQLSGEEAIPTSDTTKSIPRGNDPLPAADFERISVGVSFPRQFSFQAHLGHFALSHLSSGVASESRIRGNLDVYGQGDQDAMFLYDFNGVETGAQAAAHFSPRWSGKLNATWLTNLYAPASRSRAMRLSAETSFRVTPAITLTPTLQLFRSEGDSTPAYYNTGALAHNNRQGWGAGFKLGFPRSRLQLEGSWVSAKVIESNPFQSDFNGVLINLRQAYDLL